ncbi:hypothetical protein P8452_22372 [Trifolium repens]|nr:hypothetical protein P8452_22372 [Trifolium repens]
MIKSFHSKLEKIANSINGCTHTAATSVFQFHLFTFQSKELSFIVSILVEKVAVPDLKQLQTLLDGCSHLIFRVV